MQNFLNNYQAYRRYGFDHTAARLNTLEDAEIYTTPAERVELSYRINKLNKEQENVTKN